MSNEMLVSAVVAAIVSLLFPFLLRPLLIRMAIFDVPNHRSSHTKPTLRGGGISALAGIVLGGACLLTVSPVEREFPFIVVLSVSVLVAGVGLVEDVKGIPVLIRALLQLGLGVTIGLVAVVIGGEAWIWVPFFAIAFAYHVNATNFMDGINGISALHGAVVGTSFAAIGILNSINWLFGAGILIAVCFLAFLPWNLLPPGMFLGDVGSYLLGGSVAAVMVMAFAAGVHPLAVIGPVCIYWADTCATLFRRFLNGEPVFHAHRTHTYQRLTDLDLSHVQVSALVSAFSTMTAITGLAIGESWIPGPAGFVILIILMVVYMATPRIFGSAAGDGRGYVLPDVKHPRKIAARTFWEPEKWVVIGGSGFIGSALVAHLRNCGGRVQAFSAPRFELDSADRTPENIVKQASSLDLGELVGKLQGADVVINAAGVAAPVGGADNPMYGANSLLPSVIALAAGRAGVPRVIHLSSAAVQGSRDVLDATTEVSPFSPYSHSKALGERALLQLRESEESIDLVIARATSVQGLNRSTTRTLKRIARSPFSSVASPGTQPTVVSSVDGLCDFVEEAGRFSEALEVIQIQPWEGLSVRDVLELAGDKSPRILPRSVCRALIAVGKTLGYLAPRLAGLTRRVEMMWFGQVQEPAALVPSHGPQKGYIEAILRKKGE